MQHQTKFSKILQYNLTTYLGPVSPRLLTCIPQNKRDETSNSGTTFLDYSRPTTGQADHPHPERSAIRIQSARPTTDPSCSARSQACAPDIRALRITALSRKGDISFIEATDTTCRPQGWESVRLERTPLVFALLAGTPGPQRSFELPPSPTERRTQSAWAIRCQHHLALERKDTEGRTEEHLGSVQVSLCQRGRFGE